MSLRTGDQEPHIDVSFDCALDLAPVKRNGADLSKLIPLYTATGMVTRPATGFVSVPAGINALCVNYKGALIARAGIQSRLILVAPRSITFVRGGGKLIVQAARGEHSALLVTWQTALTPVLEGWINSRVGTRGSGSRTVGCKPIEPHFNGVLKRLEEAQSGPPELLEPLLLSAIYELTSRILTGPDEVQLANIPLGLPDTIQELVKEVRSNAAQNWPLKDAADKAGYSPFHFSRVFKALVGYGFHEYVDRSRTEAAVEMLVNTDSPVDIVASASGFGTTQGLRESVKEYLGLVPSELRNLPEGFDRDQ